jgi:hypothetical protein
VAAWLGVALATLGCGSIPVVTSKVDPVPFQDQDLEFLAPGSTDLESLIDTLGRATIVRSGGRLQVYAAAVNRGRVVLAGSVSPFKYHYLVVELDGRGIVRRFEMVRPNRTPVFGSAHPPCTSWGVCVLRDPWQYHRGFWSLGHEDLPVGDDIAVVLDTADADALAKDSRPGVDECAIFLYNAYQGGTWSPIRVATEATLWRYVPEGTYSWLKAPPGRVLIRGAYGPYCEEKDVRTLELACEPAHSYFISLSGPKCSKMSMTLEPEEIAREALRKRRLIVS